MGWTEQIWAWWSGQSEQGSTTHPEAGAAGYEAPERILTVVRGIPVEVLNSRPDIRSADVLVRLNESLALIEYTQPWRFRHLQRDVRGIRVERFACRGAYDPGDKTIITELTFLARTDIGPETVASSILHEGVHARVDSRGVRHEGREMAREERLCRRAELAFGRALPGHQGRPVVERALASLALDDHDVAPAVNWHDAIARQQAIDAAARSVNG